MTAMFYLSLWSFAFILLIALTYVDAVKLSTKKNAYHERAALCGQPSTQSSLLIQCATMYVMDKPMKLATLAQLGRFAAPNVTTLLIRFWRPMPSCISFR